MTGASSPLPAWPLDPALAALGLGPAAKIRRGMQILATAPRPPVALTASEVVFSQGRVDLRYYAPRRVRHAPVVLVPSLINRAFILDLEPGRSLVEALSAAGYPTYLVDWGVPTIADCGQGLDEVVGMLRRSIDRASRHARAPRAHLLGYCMGGTIATLLAARFPERVASLVALNAPARFSAGGRFADFVRQLDVDAAFDAEGLVPVETMKPAFQMLDPVGNVSKYLGIEAASHEPAKLARVLVRERWLEENVPLPGAFARDFIRDGYQRDALLHRRWIVHGRVAVVQDIRAPALVVACKKDFITPPAAALPLAEAIPGARAATLDVGHIGVVVGTEGPRQFYPLLDQFWSGVEA